LLEGGRYLRWEPLGETAPRVNGQERAGRRNLKQASGGDWKIGGGGQGLLSLRNEDGKQANPLDPKRNGGKEKGGKFKKIKKNAKKGLRGGV